MKRLFLLLGVVALLPSCATIFCGSKQPIILDSNIESAEYIKIDGRKYRDVKFPFTVKVRRGFRETIVDGHQEGYDESQLIIYKQFNPVSIVNLTFLLGWGIDAATGAMMQPEYRDYEIEFSPIAKKEKAE